MKNVGPVHFTGSAPCFYLKMALGFGVNAAVNHSDLYFICFYFLLSYRFASLVSCLVNRKKLYVSLSLLCSVCHEYILIPEFLTPDPSGSMIYERKS